MLSSDALSWESVTTGESGEHGHLADSVWVVSGGGGGWQQIVSDGGGEVKRRRYCLEQGDAQGNPRPMKHSTALWLGDSRQHLEYLVMEWCVGEPSV